MTPEILNILSYFMGLALFSFVGVFVGMWYQRRIISGVLTAGREQVESLFTNLFKKRASDAQNSSDSGGSGDFIGASILDYGWQQVWQEVEPEKAGAEIGSDGRERLGKTADNRGSEERAGPQGRESFSREAGGKEESEGRAVSGAA